MDQLDLLWSSPKIGTKTFAAAISIKATILAVANTAGKEGIVGSGGEMESVDARSDVATTRLAKAVALISGEVDIWCSVGLRELSKLFKFLGKLVTLDKLVAGRRGCLSKSLFTKK